MGSILFQGSLEIKDIWGDVILEADLPQTFTCELSLSKLEVMKNLVMLILEAVLIPQIFTCELLIGTKVGGLNIFGMVILESDHPQTFICELLLSKLEVMENLAMLILEVVLPQTISCELLPGT